MEGASDRVVDLSVSEMSDTAIPPAVHSSLEEGDCIIECQSCFRFFHTPAQCALTLFLR